MPMNIAATPSEREMSAMLMPFMTPAFASPFPEFPLPFPEFPPRPGIPVGPVESSSEGVVRPLPPVRPVVVGEPPVAPPPKPALLQICATSIKRDMQ